MYKIMEKKCFLNNWTNLLDEGKIYMSEKKKKILLWIVVAIVDVIVIFGIVALGSLFN